MEYLSTAATQHRVNPILLKLSVILPLLAVSGIIFWQFVPEEIFSTSTVTGGDTTAHIWGPDYLKENLLPRLSGWTQDWFGGLPAFTFYMVLPNLFAALLSFVFNANVALKLVTIGGALLIPYSAYFFGKMSGLKNPTPTVMAVFSLLFLYDDNYAIWGGNILSTLAGEFAESWGFAFALFYLGFLLKGLRTGEGRVWAAVFLALTVLSHPLTGIFAALGTICVLLLQFSFKNFKWMTIMFVIAGMLSAFWALPFVLRRGYTTALGWTKDPNYGELLFRGDWWWLFILASVGAIFSFVYAIQIGRLLTFMAVGLIAVFRFVESGHFFVNRFLPFYYLCVIFLAALAVGVIIRRLILFRSVKLLFEERQKRLMNTLLLAVFVCGCVLLVLRYFPWLEPGRNIVGWVLQNDPESAQNFLDTLVELAAIGMVGAGLAWVVVNLSVIEKNFKRGIQNWKAKSLDEPPSTNEQAINEPPSLTPAPKGPKRSFRNQLFFGAVLLTLLSVVYAVGLQLRFLGWTVDGRYGVHIPGIESVLTTKAPSSFANDWAEWNFTGYEKKVPNSFGPGWSEYSGIMETMNAVGSEHGCGRALWEYQNDRMTSYGSSFSRNLFAYWTDGCITAMDGLYTESSATSPFYYISLTGVSNETSQIVGGRQYPVRTIGNPTSAFHTGVEHLKMLGVKYYIAGTIEFQLAADAHPDLELVASFPLEVDDIQYLYDMWEFEPHSVYLVKDSDLVVPLSYEPAVIGTEDWLDRANEWWLEPRSWDVNLLANGPSTYQRLEFEEDSFAPNTPAKIPQESVVVSNIEIKDQNLRFEVDKVGVPVLVKVSYYPNWQVSGGEGPYRVAPNWMVVIPTQNEVFLSYKWTPVEYLSYGLTGLGIISAIGIYVWDRRKRLA